MSSKKTIDGVYKVGIYQCSQIPPGSLGLKTNNDSEKGGCFIIIYSITVVPIFPSLPSSTQPTPYSHSQTPHHCPCPRVIYTCSLSSPFPFFPPFPCPLPLAAVSPLHVSMSLVLFCLLVYCIH